MATRPKFSDDLPMVWRRGTLFRGVQVKPGDPVEPTIPLRKRQDLYDSCFIEVAPEQQEEERPPHENLSDEERAALTQSGA